MKTIFKTTLILYCILLTTVVYGNSVFSFDGFPNQDYGYNVYGLGMGETGIADVYRRNTGFINPSLSTTLNQVYFSSGISTGNYYYQDKDNTFRSDGINFPYFNFSIPLANHRIGFNYTPYLSGNSDFYSDINTDDYSFTEINKVRSFIYKSSFIYANKNPIANFGLSFNYLLGHRLRSWKQEYGDTQFVNPHYELNRFYKNYAFSFGLNKSINNISFGAVYNTPIELEGKTELVTSHSVFQYEESRFEVPHHIAFGFAWRLSDVYKVAADVHYELWSRTDSYEDTQDTYKLSFGLAYEPQWSDRNWKIPLRMGGYYKTLPFKVNNNYLNEQAVTFGFTIPLQTPNSQLDFSLKYLVRGDVDKHIYQDENIVFSIGFSGFDFFRSRPRKIEDREIPKAELETFR